MKKLNKLFMFLILGMIALSACESKKSEQSEVRSRPNIIFIMSDDHAYQAISAYGSNLIKTPNIDRLASQGMRFDQAFVTNSLCAPSRAVILTGKFSHLNGLRDNRQQFDSTQQTFPKILQAAGYQTAMFGKWHLKTQPTGFDDWEVLPGQGDYYNPDFLTPNGKITKQGYVTDIITNLALNWLAKIDTTKPFLLMYQHKAPHREWMPAQNHLTDTKQSPIPEPATLFDDYSGRGKAAHEAEMRISQNMGLSNDTKIRPEVLEKMGLKDKEFMKWYVTAYEHNYNQMNDEEKKNWDTAYGPINDQFEKDPPTGDSLTRWKYQRFMQDYLATIESVDDNVGRLLDYLDKTGLAKNTIVVYTSDQGFYLGEHGWFDKRFMYEESFRTPLLVRWPGKIQPGSVNNDLVQNLDFAETFLDAAGATIPVDMQGQSIVPLFSGNDNNWRDALYYHYYEYPGIHAVKRHYGIRTKQYKLIHFYYDIDEWELYDLKKDPHEMKNVIDDAEYSQVKDELMQKLTGLRVKYQDSDSLTQAILHEDLAAEKQ